MNNREKKESNFTEFIEEMNIKISKAHMRHAEHIFEYTLYNLNQ